MKHPIQYGVLLFVIASCTSINRKLFQRQQNSFCFWVIFLFWQSPLLKQVFCHLKTSLPSSTSWSFQGRKVLPWILGLLTWLKPIYMSVSHRSTLEGGEEFDECFFLVGESLGEGNTAHSDWLVAFLASCSSFCLRLVRWMMRGESSFSLKWAEL